MRRWFRRPASGDNLTAVLDVALYRGEPEDRRDISALDLGSFLRQFLEVPHDCAAAGRRDSIRLEVQWQQPWELTVYAHLAGSDAFLRAVLTGLGRRLAGWLTDQVSQLGGTARPAVRFGNTAAWTVGRVDPASPDRAADTLELGLVNALSSERLHVIVEPRS
jgi:hypothetical protein